MKYILSLFILFVAVIQLNAAIETNVLTVTTVLYEPYAMISREYQRKNSITNRSETVGGVLVGYAIDLLRILAEKVHFNYTVRLVKDGAYGSRNETSGTWNGMIGEVIRGEADLAVAALTITGDRQRVVEFSYPFLTTGIGLIAKRPPYYSCEKNVTSIPYNCDLHIYPVNEIKDLPFQNVVQFGASGWTAEFFRNSKDKLFSKIGKNMETMPSISEGIQKVWSSNGKYVFLMDYLAIEYWTAISCDFVQLGPTLLERSYGIAIINDSYLKTPINLGLLTMQEEGILDQLKKKWMPNPKMCDNHLDAVYAKNALNVVLSSFK